MFSSLLRGKTKAASAKKRDGEVELLAIDGEAVAVTVRLNPRARRMIVKVDPGTGAVVVTAPSRRGLGHALDFARGEKAWIARQLARVPKPVLLAPGAHGVPPWIDAWELARPGEPHAPTAGLHGGAGAPFTFDYAFVSPALAPRVRALRIDAAATGSDHQPLLLELA